MNNLYDQITEEYLDGESMNTISKKYKVSIYKIKKELIRRGIRVRGLSESVNLSLSEKDQTILSPETVELLSGNLLGDGSLRKRNTRAYYAHIDKNISYLKWLRNTLEEDGLIFSGIYRTSNGCYALQSHTSSSLNALYKLFYPEGKRVVPDSLMVTPMILRQWYLSDGSVATHGGIAIACSHFTEKMRRNIETSIGVSVTYHEDKIRGYGKYYIKKADTEQFLQYIGKCPDSSYDYKWNI
jgi:hypothetical protein